MSARIESWQRILKAGGYYDGPLDGIAGPRTLEATKRYQGYLRHMGLYRGEIDGVAGPMTMQAHRLNVGGQSGAKGIERTDWRGNSKCEMWNAELIQAILPDRAGFLVPSFLRHAETWNLNPLFLIAISRHETANWRSNAFRNRGNAMGISNPSGVVNTSSHDESIRIAARSLGRPGGLYSAAVTLADVAAIYAPVGAANDPGKRNSYWPGLVARYWAELDAAVIRAGGAK